MEENQERNELVEGAVEHEAQDIIEQQKELISHNAKKQKEIINKWGNITMDIIAKIFNYAKEYDKQRKCREIIGMILSFLLKATLIVAFIVVSYKFISLFDITPNEKDAIDIKEIVDAIKEIAVYIVVVFAGITISIRPFIKRSNKISKIINTVLGEE